MITPIRRPVEKDLKANFIVLNSLKPELESKLVHRQAFDVKDRL